MRRYEVRISAYLYIGTPSMSRRLRHSLQPLFRRLGLEPISSIHTPCLRQITTALTPLPAERRHGHVARQAAHRRAGAAKSFRRLPRRLFLYFPAGQASRPLRSYVAGTRRWPPGFSASPTAAQAAASRTFDGYFPTR